MDGQVHSRAATAVFGPISHRYVSRHTQHTYFKGVLVHGTYRLSPRDEHLREMAVEHAINNSRGPLPHVYYVQESF
jgi:hypothetical protein